MRNSINILKKVILNEDEITRMLYALCGYKSFREVLVRFLTGGKFGADDVSWEDMGVQANIGGIRPDFYALNESISLLVEIKTSLYTGLTGSQPTDYLTWLEGFPQTGERFFVALVPARYAFWRELERRLNSWSSQAGKVSISAVILTWEDFLDRLSSSDLPQFNQYIGDFFDLIYSWLYEAPLKLTHSEVEKMYAKETATGISKLLKIVEKICTELEKNYHIDRSFNKRWWDKGEYGVCIKKGNHYLLWFGLWQAYWEYSGIPLCYGVAQNWHNALVKKFQEINPQNVTFPKGDPKAYLLANIDKEVYLAEDQVGKIIALLEKNLQNLSPIFDDLQANQS